jgi:hypothetical protein
MQRCRGFGSTSRLLCLRMEAQSSNLHHTHSSRNFHVSMLIGDNRYFSIDGNAVIVLCRGGIAPPVWKSALDKVEWSASIVGRLILWKIGRGAHWTVDWVRPIVRLNALENVTAEGRTQSSENKHTVRTPCAVSSGSKADSAWSRNRHSVLVG